MLWYRTELTFCDATAVVVDTIVDDPAICGTEALLIAATCHCCSATVFSETPGAAALVVAMVTGVDFFNQRGVVNLTGRRLDTGYSRVRLTERLI